MRFSDILELISTGSTAVIAIATAAGVIMAIYQLNVWRVQAQGTTEYNLAREVLRAVYEVREGFKHVRSPAIYPYEYPPHLIGSDHDVYDKDRVEALKYAYDQRLKLLDEGFQKLENLSLEAEVQPGS